MNAPARYGQPKVPPHNLEAEQSVLGGVILNPRAWYDVVAVLSSADFYRPQHQLIFEAMGRLVDRNVELDVVTITDELGDQLERAGGIGYLAEVIEGTPGASNVLAYARIVREHAIARALIGAAHRIGEMAFADDGRPVADKLNEAQAEIMGLAIEQRLVTARAMRDVLHDVVQDIEHRYKELGADKDAVRGLSTGFVDLDHRWRGLKPGNLYVLAGRPSMGKTTLAMNIAQHVAANGHRVLVFSLEMTAEELAERAIASTGGIAHHDLESGSVFARADGPGAFTGAVSRLSPLDLFIDDTAGMDLPRIRARTRQLSVERPVRLVLIDHLQLMSGEGRTETEILSNITKGAKALAKELRCPVVLLSQLSREVDKRPYGKNRPVMSDLRGSGSIEQDADLIAFIYRNAVYKPSCAFSTVAEVITAKFRNGRIGTDYLQADLERCRFRNYGGEKPQYDGPAGDADAGFPED